MNKDILEPGEGNLYHPHNLQVHSGKFWRCKHGKTGFGNNMVWEGCMKCKKCNGQGIVQCLVHNKTHSIKSSLDWRDPIPKDISKPIFYTGELTCPECHGEKEVRDDS